MPPGYKRRTRFLYKPGSKDPYRISRSKIDLFYDCPRCFYLDQRLGIPRTSFPSFTLNNAVDELLKREFDAYRARGEAHPLMEEHGIDAIPFDDPRMEEWRDALRHGVKYHHKPTNLLVRGGVDDVWVTPAGELIVVDYKATSKKEAPTLDGYWQGAYKRQAEVYQWLLRMNGFEVLPTAYFVYVNGNSNADSFGGRLEFDIDVLPYEGDDSWIDPILVKIKETLDSDEIPRIGDNCEYCAYREIAGKELQRIHKENKERNSNKKLL